MWAPDGLPCITITNALELPARAAPDVADLTTDNAVAAVCFILSRVLGLAVPFLTANTALFDVIRAAVALARGPARILVVGEVGVGKEAMVKLVHAASGAPAELLHAECAGLEADAVEAEVAPLVQDAANVDPGAARGGAIFFNRIGELAAPVQRKLADLLSGAPANIRILAASVKPLSAMAAEGEMLPELAGLFDAVLTIAPLRARREDLPLLVRHYLRMLNPALMLNAAALKVLGSYPFPGNVLELINFLTRVAIVPPLSGTRRGLIGRRALAVVGRAETISQLYSGALDSAWLSHHRWKLDSVQPGPGAVVRPDGDAAGAGAVSAPAPASMRLTTGTVPRLRKPRGGHHSPA